MKACILVVMLMFLPPNRNIALKTFCEGWLATEPTYRFPLDEFTVGAYYEPRFSMGEKQRVYQMRKKHKLSGVPGDFNTDGRCDFKDFAVLANWWKGN